MEEKEETFFEIHSEFYKFSMNSNKNQKLTIKITKVHSIIPIEYQLEKNHKEFIKKAIF